jgi:signal transduction histidine kinase
MNGVLGMARLLKQTALSDEQWEYVKAIIQSGETLLNIVNDILDVSKIGILLSLIKNTLFTAVFCVIVDSIKILWWHCYL